MAEAAAAEGTALQEGCSAGAALRCSVRAQFQCLSSRVLLWYEVNYNLSSSRHCKCELGGFQSPNYLFLLFEKC